RLRPRPGRRGPAPGRWHRCHQLIGAGECGADLHRTLMGHIFPWRSGNRFALLIDGPSFFPAMLEAIAGAEQEVLLELYLVEDGRCSEVLVEALAAAARRGVEVRCLFDGF